MKDFVLKLPYHHEMHGTVILKHSDFLTFLNLLHMNFVSSCRSIIGSVIGLHETCICKSLIKKGLQQVYLTGTVTSTGDPLILQKAHQTCSGMKMDEQVYGCVVKLNEFSDDNAV